MNLLNFVGMGTVASTKDTNTFEIMVYIPSLFPAADGRVVASAEAVERKSTNANGEEVKSNLLHSNTIPAVWKNMGDSSRLTAPDVREGSQVAIYQVSGQNRYYWTTFGVNSQTYRLETVIYGWNANPKLDENADFDIGSYYVVKVDTRTGLMALRTSQANGETSAFDIQVNGMDGVFSVGASQGSYVAMNDKDQSFMYANKDGTVIGAEKKKIGMVAKESIGIFAEEELNLKAKTLNVQAKTMNIDVELTRWKGRIERTGDTEQKGNLVQEGNFTQDGNTNSTGVIHADTDVTTNLVSTNGHTHGGVDRGGARTDPAAV